MKLPMNISSTCLKVVYDSFIRKGETEKLKYLCDLLTRGVGGLEFENRKSYTTDGDGGGGGERG